MFTQHQGDVRCSPSSFHFTAPLHVLLREIKRSVLFRHLSVIQDSYLAFWRHDHPRSVLWVLGAARAIHRDAFSAVNGFDEYFFIYYEVDDGSRILVLLPR